MVIRGKDFKFYRNSDDPYDNTPTWTLVENIKDLTRNREKALADASTRASSYRMQVGTLKDLSVEFGMVYDTDDTDMIAFEDAFENDENVEILLLDQLISVTGARGIRLMAQVTNFGDDENLEDIGMVNVTMVPGFAPDNLPRRVHVVTPGSVVDVT